METKQSNAHTACDICHQEFVEGDQIHHDDGDDEIVHVACVQDWFRSSFGRESLS